MRILFIVPYVPNLIRVRPYNMIRYLTALGHEVTVLTLWSNEEERADAEALKEHCHRVVALPLPRWRSLWNCLRALPTRVPLQVVYCWSPELAHQLSCQLSVASCQPTGNQQLATNHDLVHVEHLRGAYYGLAIKGLQLATGNWQPPVVWDSVDCISYLFGQAAQDSRSLSGRWMTRLELGRTRRYEGWLVNQFDRVLVTSDVDRQALIELARRFAEGSRETEASEGTWGHGDKETRGRGDVSPLSSSSPLPITVLPNGVDLDYFTPADEPRDPATLVISGKMSYHANVTAVLYLVNDIMPHVWAQRPDVQVWIVGKDPPRKITKLKAQSLKFKVQIPNPKSQIHVIGTVPDIRLYLRRATIAVAPMPYGAGIQNKVLEAMACGTPVVASPQAVSALGTRPGGDLLVAEGAEAFAQVVLRLLADADLRARLGADGRRYVEAHHDWREVAEKLEGIYEETIERKKGEERN